MPVSGPGGVIRHARRSRDDLRPLSNVSRVGRNLCPSSAKNIGWGSHNSTWFPVPRLSFRPHRFGPFQSFNRAVRKAWVPGRPNSQAFSAMDQRFHRAWGDMPPGHFHGIFAGIDSHQPCPAGGNFTACAAAEVQDNTIRRSARAKRGSVPPRDQWPHPCTRIFPTLLRMLQRPAPQKAISRQGPGEKRHTGIQCGADPPH